MQDSTRMKKRKFPGPAGMLIASASMIDTPLKSSRTDVLSLQQNSHSPELMQKEIESVPSSQSSGDLFSSPPWKALIQDLGADAETTMSKFSIKTMLLKAKRKLLPKGKIPLILGVIDSLDMQGLDASVVIRDSSGKMQGSLHRDLFKDSITAVQTGSVIVLRQVSVISPSPRTHYLNITPWNVVLVYTPGRDGADVSKTPWQASPLRTMDSNLSSDENVKFSLDSIVKESERELRAPPQRVDHNKGRFASSPHSAVSSPVFRPNITDGYSTPFKSPVFVPGRGSPSFSTPSPIFPSVANRGSVQQHGHHPLRGAVPQTSSPSTTPSHGSTSVSIMREPVTGSSVQGKYKSGGATAYPKTADSMFNISMSDTDLDADFPEDNDDEDLLLLCDATGGSGDRRRDNDSASLNFAAGSTDLLCPASTPSALFTGESRTSAAGLTSAKESGSEGKVFRFKKTNVSPTDVSATRLAGNSAAVKTDGGLSREFPKPSWTSLSNNNGAKVFSNERFDHPEPSCSKTIGSESTGQQQMERDSRVELRKDHHVPSEPAQTSNGLIEDYWDNDLSDELLSQLTEDF